MPPRTRAIGTRTLTCLRGRPSRGALSTVTRSHFAAVATGSDAPAVVPPVAPAAALAALADAVDAAPSTARSNWSASSTVILPCARSSRIRRASLVFAMIGPQVREHLAHGQFAAFELGEEFGG